MHGILCWQVRRFLRSRQCLDIFIPTAHLLRDIFSGQLFNDRVTKGTLWEDKERGGGMSEASSYGKNRWEWQMAGNSQGRRKKESLARH